MFEGGAGRQLGKACPRLSAAFRLSEAGRPAEWICVNVVADPTKLGTATSSSLLRHSQTGPVILYFVYFCVLPERIVGNVVSFRKSAILNEKNHIDGTRAYFRWHVRIGG